MIVEPSRSTVDPEPADRITPVDVLLNVPPVRTSVPPAVASMVPLLVTAVVGAICKVAA